MATLLEIFHEKTIRYDWAIGEALYISPKADLDECGYPETINVNGYTFERANGIPNHFHEYRCIRDVRLEIAQPDMQNVTQEDIDSFKAVYKASMMNGSWRIMPIVAAPVYELEPLPFDTLQSGSILTEQQHLTKHGHADI